MGDAGIGDQYVETLMMGDNRLYCGICGPTVGHIKCRSHSTKAAIADSTGYDL